MPILELQITRSCVGFFVERRQFQDMRWLGQSLGSTGLQGAMQVHCFRAIGNSLFRNCKYGRADQNLEQTPKWVSDLEVGGTNLVCDNWIRNKRTVTGRRSRGGSSQSIRSDNAIRTVAGWIHIPTVACQPTISIALIYR